MFVRVWPPKQWCSIVAKTPGSSGFAGTSGTGGAGVDELAGWFILVNTTWILIWNRGVHLIYLNIWRGYHILISDIQCILWLRYIKGISYFNSGIYLNWYTSNIIQYYNHTSNFDIFYIFVGYSVYIWIGCMINQSVFYDLVGTWSSDPVVGSIFWSSGRSTFDKKWGASWSYTQRFPNHMIEKSW